ncbi:MAG: hypothetical protein IK002_01225 [Treponema sp.]|uniref:hypothetical protein n=1 Tax=Treponema sp. TaxID=166 RepID=UPI00298D93EF|nr:hypothetical protein [Treponema sp.]MBR5932586.1 hypothetical protein [Treponema sp.]
MKVYELYSFYFPNCSNAFSQAFCKLPQPLATAAEIELAVTPVVAAVAVAEAAIIPVTLQNLQDSYRPVLRLMLLKSCYNPLKITLKVPVFCHHDLIINQILDSFTNFQKKF